MRVLVTSTSGYGHVFPMVPLARALVAAGHEVRWATSADACPRVAEAGLTPVAAGLSGAELRGQVGAVRDVAATVAGPDRGAFMFPRMFGELFAPPMVADLLPLAQQWRPEVLVHEQGELAAPLVGAVLGIPVVTHSFGGAIPPAFVAEAGERLAPLWAQHGQPVLPYAGCFASLFLDICPPEVQSVPLDHIPTVQPLRPVAYTGPEPAELPSFLGEHGTPLVYLTLGTVRASTSVLRSALERLVDLPVRLLVTVGPDGDPTALGAQPEHVTVTRFVPQTQVLPRCAVVVSHAGSGTFLGALAHGVPQLCLPQAADQFRNAAGGARSGAALVLGTDEVSADAVAEAVHRLLEEGDVRGAARRVAGTIAAMPSPEEVVPVLESLTRR